MGMGNAICGLAAENSLFQDRDVSDNREGKRGGRSGRHWEKDGLGYN